MSIEPHEVGCSVCGRTVVIAGPTFTGRVTKDEDGRFWQVHNTDHGHLTDAKQWEECPESESEVPLGPPGFLGR